MRRSFLHALVGGMLMFATTLGSAGCGEDSLKHEGESCSFSSECGDGLFCDLSNKPAMCIRAGVLHDMTIVIKDLTVGADQSVVAPEDLLGADLFGADLSVTPDLAKHD